MNFKILSVTLIAAVLLTAGCNNEDNDTSGIARVTGTVIDAASQQPVADAVVRIQQTGDEAETDEDGLFDFEVEIDSTMNLTALVSMTGYGSATRTEFARAGQTVSFGTIQLTANTGGGGSAPVSGRASNILLLSQSSQSIGVRESGSTEVAQIVFQATDSLGRPVTLSNAANINFTFGSNPGGGAFIYPETARTDNQGRATANLSSGTTAGVVQVVAEATVDGRTIRSLPVSVAIHGGMPDQDHFTLGPERFNFPGRRAFGLTNPISVIVGDKYGNPVKQGTAVYFTTSHSVIEGSVLTGASGGGSVNLISANPRPSDGIAIVTATTADENQNDVTAQTPVLLSGPAVLEVSPGYAALNTTYTVTISDDLGNPLTQGTSLNVRVEGTKVKAVGSTSVQLADTDFDDNFQLFRPERLTTYTFRAVADENLDEGGTPTVEAITITTNGPNGGLELVLEPQGAQVASKNSKMTHTADGVRVELEE